MLWRAELRIHEALALTKTELNLRRGSVLIRTERAIGDARAESTAGAIGQLAP